MGNLIAFLSKKGEDVSDYLVKILHSGTNKISEIEGFSNGKEVIYKKTIDLSDVPKSSIALGYSLNKIMPNDPPQPLIQHGYSFSVEGRHWDNTDQVSAAYYADILGLNPKERLRHLIKNNIGSFAINILSNEEIIVGRDSIGKIPLYYGEDNSIIVTSSTKKMLWELGLDAHSFNPGSMGKITKNGIFVEKVRELVQPPIEDKPVEKATSELNFLLKNSVFVRSLGLSRASLGFSGGIDSSILAYYLTKIGLDLELICVGLEGSRDFESALEAADSLDLPLKIESFISDDIEEDVKTVLWLIEEPDPMKVSVAIPFYWVTKTMAQSESKVLFSGNGSDELFGGYYKHSQEYLKDGDTVVNSIFRDVSQSYRVNYERDYKLCNEMGLELRLPFSDFSLIQWGLSIPPHLKLSKQVHGPRKLILRHLAQRLGLNEKITSKPKKAIQYSTGVSRALNKLAKKNGKSLNNYLSDLFSQIKTQHLGSQDT
jgi:asparagine synthase (glutamine-hydrolysing)